MTDNQLRQLKTFAGTQNWEITHEFVDRASGKRGDREQFQSMFAAASKREFDCLLKPEISVLTISSFAY